MAMMAVTLPITLPRRHVYFDGVVLVAATAGMLATLIGWADNPVRIVVGLVLALFSPGYALLMALFPRGSSSAERFGLSVPASLVLAVLIGAVVNETPFGLSGNLIVILLWVCTVALLAVAYARLLRWEASRPSPTPAVSRNGNVSLLVTSPRKSSFHVGIAGAVATALVVVVGGAWAAGSLVVASRTSPKRFTALSVNGATGMQQPGQPLAVTLDNQEGQPMRYTVEVSNNGSVVSHTENIDLESGSQYAFPLPLTADTGDGVDVAVYRAGDSQPYRLVHVGGATEGQ